MKSNNAEKVFEWATYSSIQTMSFWESFAYFSKTMLHLLQQHGIVVEKSRCWAGLPAFISGKHLHSHEMKNMPKTAEQLESLIRREWEKIPLLKVHQLVANKLLLKTRWYYTVVFSLNVKYDVLFSFTYFLSFFGNGLYVRLWQLRPVTFTMLIVFKYRIPQSQCT